MIEHARENLSSLGEDTIRRHVRSRRATASLFGSTLVCVRIYTKTGDDGTTGLLYGGRTSKDELRVEAYGASDEAVAALGVARAVCRTPGLADLILRLQRELFV